MDKTGKEQLGFNLDRFGLHLAPCSLRSSLKLIQQYSIDNQFQKQQKMSNLILNTQAVNPLQYYFYFLPVGYCLPHPVNAQIQLKSSSIGTTEQTLPIADPTIQIVLTREDLLREGYESSKRPWSKEEDRLLLRLCKNEHARFQEIASQMQGRNSKMCYSRFRRLTYQTKLQWTEEQDERLMNLVQQYGQERWKLIENHFKGRTQKQIRDHYENFLKPDVNHNSWSIDEDYLLITLINTFGKNWKQIENKMVGRTQNQIKNRFFGKITRLNAKKLSQIEKSRSSQI